jgi:iron only hydrogenase large subunit-like protein
MMRTGGVAELLATMLKEDYIVVNEVRNIEKMLRNLKAGRIQTEIIEAMICPGGCVGV